MARRKRRGGAAVAPSTGSASAPSQGKSQAPPQASQPIPRRVQRPAESAREAARTAEQSTEPRLSPSRLGLVAALASGLIALAVYLVTLAPDLPPGDSGDMITAACVRGVAHPPGYPLYTLVGALFCAVPLGLPPLRLNLFSALTGAAAVGLVALLIYRLIESSRRDSRQAVIETWAAPLAAVVGALALAFSPTFWTYSLVAEVFALNALFAALLLLLLLEWEGDPTRVRLFWAFAFVCGLAASHHHTIVLLAPAFLVLLWSGARRLSARGLLWSRRAGAFQFRHLLIAAGFLLLGLLPYLYLPLAARSDPLLNWGDPRTLSDFIRHVGRGDYGTLSLSANEAETGGGSRLEQLNLIGHYFLNAFTPVGLILVALGGWWLARRRPARAIALLLAFLVPGPLFVMYANPLINTPLWISTLERFYILPSIPFVAALGVGAYALLGLARGLLANRAAARLVAPAVGAALLIIPLGLAVMHYGTAKLVDNHMMRSYGEDLLAPLEPGALLLSRGDINIFSTEYLQFVERYRADVTVLDAEKLKRRNYVEQMRRQHPSVIIPFDVYDGGQRTTLKTLLDANMPLRPVYVVGSPPDRELQAGFDSQRSGFADRALPKGSSSDPLTIYRERPEPFSQYRFPPELYPEKAFEGAISRTYGVVASQLAAALHVTNRAAEAEPLYRTAIKLAPTQSTAYKNLGLILSNRGDSPAEVILLWEQYVRQRPDDPEAPAMRAQIETLRSRVR